MELLWVGLGEGIMHIHFRDICRHDYAIFDFNMMIMGVYSDRNYEIKNV